MIDDKKLMDAIDSLDNDKNYDIKQAEKAARDVGNDEAIKERKTSDKANVILIIIFIILILTAVIYYASPASKEKEIALDENLTNANTNGSVTMYAPEGTQLVNTNDFGKIKSNIVIEKEFFDINGKLNFLVKNNNSIDVNDVIVSVVYYDGLNNIIAIDEDTINIMSSGQSQYITFNEKIESPEKYETLIEVKERNYAIQKSYIKDVTFECSVTEDNDSIIIRGMNNSEVKLDGIEFEVIYYGEEDKVLYVDRNIEFDVKRNKSFEIEEFISIYDKEYNKIPYTRYEVKLVNAYAYVR